MRRRRQFEEYGAAAFSLAFGHAIAIAQRDGMDEDEIARVTGLTVPMIRAVLRTPS